jgi:DNA-binding ferritin-like protein
MSVSRRPDSAALGTPTDLSPANVSAITVALNPLVADAFALYLKTKNFHWHVSGPHFRDYHLLLNEQGDQIFAMTDGLAERVRKIGGTTLRSIGHIFKLQRITDNDLEFVAPTDMLRELMEDNKAFTGSYPTLAETSSARRKAEEDMFDPAFRRIEPPLSRTGRARSTYPGEQLMRATSRMVFAGSP